MSGYIGNIPVPQATQTRDVFTATASQTTFSTSGYTPNYLDVYLNGVHLDPADYTATNGTDVVLATGADAGDSVIVVAWTTFSPADVTVADINDLTVTATELNYVDGVTSNIQTQLDGKQATLVEGTDYLAPDGDGSQLTGLAASFADLTDTTVSTSDPADNTNPSATGHIWVNKTSGECYVCTDATTNNNVWTNIGSGSGDIPGAYASSGGTITTADGYRIHTFTSSGTITFTTAGEVEYLVIAGGGGGGCQMGGGGGAGGYRSSIGSESSGGGASTQSLLTVSATSYSVTVGAGGAGSPSGGSASRPLASSGSNSVFSTITSTGGGGGASYRTNGNGMAGASGGSGGGGAVWYGMGGSGTSGQGYAGGQGGDDNGGNLEVGGGGGGAGGNGRSYNYTTGQQGDGGAPITSSATGTAVARAGGGGGASHNGVKGDGGGGGAGNGSLGSGVQGGDATANTGSGGGGAGEYNARGGNGGSGIVIIRYPL